MKEEKRNSNIELLRIISMILIIAYHARNVSFVASPATFLNGGGVQKVYLIFTLLL